MADESTVSPEIFLAMGREVLAQQAFSVLLGTELTALTPGHCEMQVPVTNELKQQNGYAHPGIVCYLADNALTFAGGTAMRVPVAISEFKINYVRPAIGEQLVVRADAEHTGQSQAVCRCEVFVVRDGTTKLCALAQGTVVRLREGASA